MFEYYQHANLRPRWLYQSWLTYHLNSQKSCPLNLRHPPKNLIQQYFAIHQRYFPIFVTYWQLSWSHHPPYSPMYCFVPPKSYSGFLLFEFDIAKFLVSFETQREFWQFHPPKSCLKHVMHLQFVRVLVGLIWSTKIP